MMHVKDVLSKYVTDVPELGPEQSLPLDRIKLDLDAVRHSGDKVFMISVIMLVLLFVGAFVVMVFSFVSLHNFSIAAAAFSVTGVSFPWIIRTMLDASKEKTRSDMMLALVGTLNPEIVRSVLLASQAKPTA